MIRIVDLWAGYGDLDTLRGFDLHVPDGGITCIVGPNGAGKSTVLKAVSGILRARRGTIEIDGADITSCPPAAILRSGVVHVPQRHGLFTRLTVRENVLMGAYVIRHRRRQINDRYEQLAEVFPLLRQRAHTPAGMLSGGQRRSVEFARAMMLDPTVVLLDEPTLGLDPRGLAVIRGSVEAMNAAGATVLMVEQNVRFGLSLSHEAAVMTAGTVTLAGRADVIAARPDLMDLLFASPPEKPEASDVR